MTFEPLNIIGIDTDNVGTPRNDGSPGSGLYSVPIRLSRRVTAEEGRVLEQLWDQPPSFTTMHRPGIARADGDRLTLDGTTVDEVASHHFRTLRLVVGQFNEHMTEVVKRRAQDEARERAMADAHRQHVREVADRVRFD